MNQPRIFPQLKVLKSAPYLATIKSGTGRFPVVSPYVIDESLEKELLRDNTATFIMEDEDYRVSFDTSTMEKLTLHWPMPDGVHADEEQFRTLCYAQAEYFNAQLLHGGFKRRVWAFTWDRRKNEDTVESFRHSIPLSYFETIARGGQPHQFGILVKPWFASKK